MTTLATRLVYSDAKSHKEYSVVIEQKGEGHVVNFAYGRVGGSLKTGTKTVEPVALESAQKIADKLIKDKTKKGYIPDDPSAPNMPVESVKMDVLFQCQLSNPVSPDDAREMLQSKRYVAQTKYDGERRPLIIQDGQVMAMNRNGTPVSVNPSFIEPLVDLANLSGGKLILDTEDMGTHLQVFDVLFVEGRDLMQVPFHSRVVELDKLDLKTNSDVIRFVESVRIYCKTQLDLILGFAKNSGQEGVILREYDAIYEAGRPNSGGTSLKIKFTNDLSAIVKKQIGNRRSVNLVLLDDKGGEVDMGNVTIPANVANIPQEGDILDVQYLWALEGGKLIQPVYKRNRTGEIKPDACTLSQVVIKNPQEVSLALAS